MRIQDLTGKRICLLGHGKEGKAMEEALKRHVPQFSLTVIDPYPDGRALDTFDVVIKSPGIPPDDTLNTLGSKLTSSTQIFLDSISDSGATVIGVTGSKGKSTTSTLIFGILKAGDANVSLIGNIGEPAISHIDEAKSGKIFVMEMSSYQLNDLTVSPQIAVVTSFFPEHLDYHCSLEAYKEAKKHIARFQKKNDVIFFSRTSEGATEIAEESHGTHIPFSAEDCPVSITDTKLIGDHNRSNIAAAFKVGTHLKIDPNVMLNVIKNFQGLPHRLQSLGVHHGIEWIDDAISTTPESTIAALDALGDRVATIILGGQDRGNDFTGLAKRIKNSSVKTVILFPGTGPRIHDALMQSSCIARIFEAGSMEDAVSLSKENTQPETRLPAEASAKEGNPKPIVLLSTASPSYNMFKNFEEKGDEFKKCIFA